MRLRPGSRTLSSVASRRILPFYPRLFPAMAYPFPLWEIPTVPVHGSAERFPVRHIYCVGRNYAEHAREMGGNPDKEPPFFFTKPADAIVPVVPPAVGEVRYPIGTKDYHFELELVV